MDMRAAFERAAWAALLAMGLAGTARADEAAVANIGQQPVSGAEITAMLPTLTPAQREHAAKDPKVVAQLVRIAVGRKLLLEEAKRQAWDKKPEIAAQIERARDEITFATYLQSASLPSPDYPSADEVRQAYEANRDKFTIPTQYHIAQIFIADPAGGSKETTASADKKARELDKRAKAKGADFAELARSGSDDPATARRGGDLGWLPENQLMPEIKTAVLALGGKGVTDPIHAPGGWHIIQVMGTAPPVLPPLDQLHDTIVKLLRESKANAFVDKLLEDKHVTVNETAAAAFFEAKP
jgi:parvulin-like peptidyl-prolyl isomerase